MASVKYSLSKKAPIAGQAEVLVRFSAGHPYDFSARSSIFVPVVRWSAQAGGLSFSFKRFVSPESIALLVLQKKLDDLRTFILQSYVNDPGAAVSRAWLVNNIACFHDPGACKPRLSLQELIDMYLSSTDLAKGTIDQYMVIRRMLDRFAESGHLLMADSVTAQELDEFVRFISAEESVGRGRGRTTIKRGRNTIATKLKKLRAVCAFGVRRGIMPRSPFDEYVIPSEVYGTPNFLYLAERDAVYSLDDLSPALAIQRDVFIFQCHIGCRVSDLADLKKSNVVFRDGMRHVQYIQEKLKRSRPVTISVPLDDVAAEIVDRYASLPGDALLPFISNDKYNDCIKVILRRAGITRQVVIQDPKTLESVSVPICDIASSHLARRTFAANVFKATGSDRIVSSMTGWAPGSASVARYSVVDDEMKAAVLAELAKKSHRNPTE